MRPNTSSLFFAGEIGRTEGTPRLSFNSDAYSISHLGRNSMLIRDMEVSTQNNIENNNQAKAMFNELDFKRIFSPNEKEQAKKEAGKDDEAGYDDQQEGSKESTEDMAQFQARVNRK